jgi:hypothetical protein
VLVFLYDLIVFKLFDSLKKSQSFGVQVYPIRDDVGGSPGPWKLVARRFRAFCGANQELVARGLSACGQSQALLLLGGSPRVRTAPGDERGFRLGVA